MPHNPLAYARGYKAGINGRQRPEAIQPAEQREVDDGYRQGLLEARRKNDPKEPPLQPDGVTWTSHRAPPQETEQEARQRQNRETILDMAKQAGGNPERIDAMYESWKRRHGKN